MNYSGNTKKHVKLLMITSLMVGFLCGLGAGSLGAKNFTKEVQQIEPMVEEPAHKSLGEYTITAYCSCEKCCGEWAKNRPGGVVLGASGAALVDGVSCASTLPLGTEVIIAGVGAYIVDDKPADWIAEKYGNKIIDLYFSDHEAAQKFGIKKQEVMKNV